MPSGQLSDSAQASQFAAGKILGLVGVCLEYVLQARRAQQLILHKYVLVLLVVCCREVSTAGDKQTGNSVHKAPLQPTLKPTSKLALDPLVFGLVGNNSQFGDGAWAVIECLSTSEIISMLEI